MVTMNVLNEAEITANVKLRYLKDLIFTYIGPTLIVMNPYKAIKESFLPSVLDLY
jgi:myosin-7